MPHLHSRQLTTQSHCWAVQIPAAMTITIQEERKSYNKQDWRLESEKYAMAPIQNPPKTMSKLSSKLDFHEWKNVNSVQFPLARCCWVNRHLHLLTWKKNPVHQFSKNKRIGFWAYNSKNKSKNCSKNLPALNCWFFASSTRKPIGSLKIVKNLQSVVHLLL